MEPLLHFASSIAVPLWVLGTALLIVIAAFWQMRRAQVARGEPRCPRVLPRG